MSAPATLVWFRLDLRLRDNPALAAAVQHGGVIVPVFIWSPEEEAPWQPGALRILGRPSGARPPAGSYRQPAAGRNCCTFMGYETNPG